jgi:isocitrate dehydrogenase
MKFADKLEASSIRTIEDGVMTKDLAILSEAADKKVVNTKEFLLEIKKRLC